MGVCGLGITLPDMGEFTPNCAGRLTQMELGDTYWQCRRSHLETAQICNRRPLVTKTPVKGFIQMQWLGKTTTSLADRKTKMPKGHLCPDCGTYTLQPISTNWLQCSNCDVKRPA